MNITMSELARRAGVTRPAVSAVLNNSSCSRVSAEKRTRILELARETGYIPNQAARQLKGISNRLVGLITVPSHMGIMATLQSELISALQRLNYEVLTAQVRQEPAQVLREFQSRCICGMIVLGSFPCQPDHPFCPVVSCAHDSFSGFDVTCDKEAGCYEAAKHLIEVHGRRRLTFVSIGVPGLSNRLKHVGMVRALREAGLPSGPETFLTVTAEELKRTVHEYYEAECADGGKIASALLRRKADGIICANDFIAGRLIPFLQKAGVHIPRDMSVVGHDGYSWTRFATIPLATIVQPVRRMAEATVDALVRRIGGIVPENETDGLKIKPCFLPGASCGCEIEPPPLIDGIAETIITEGEMT